MEFLEDRHLVQKEPDLPLFEIRKAVEAGEFLKILDRTAKTINSTAGSLLIDAQSYLWPEPLIRSFAVQKGREEFVMQIELWEGCPTLSFIVRRARETFLSRFLPWVITHWLGLHEMEIVVKSAYTFDTARVTSRNVDDWFIYLLSGFERSLLPAFPGTRPADRASESAAKAVEARDPVIADEFS